MPTDSVARASLRPNSTLSPIHLVIFGINLRGLAMIIPFLFTIFDIRESYI
jgi:hypothetical protein